MTSYPAPLSARLNANETLGDRVLKVNHAGEHAAIGIYAGQIAVARVTAPHLVAELREFMSHEKRHRAVFWSELQRRGRPRCRSYWLCGGGGFVLGIVTGLCGSAAIHATTAAVENVVLGHLAQQMAALRGKDAAALAAIASIVEEEQQHHDQSARRATGRFWLEILIPVVALSTEAVIWFGMHL
jgi:ubiquinone biosynthesis monooxygenase Coq7